MTELEQALAAVGRSIDYPATPDLASTVRRRLAEVGARPGFRPGRRRALVAALVVLAVAAGGVLLVPQARSTVLDWLGIGNVTIRYVDELPSVDKATPELELGEPVSLDEALERAGYTVQVPRASGLDDPPQVYFREGDRQVAFLYGSEDDPRLLITQAAAGGAVQKLASVGTDVERVLVDAVTPGLWLSGDKHALFYPAAREEEPFRLVGNALIYETADGVTVRIEAEISREEALRLAGSMEPLD